MPSIPNPEYVGKYIDGFEALDTNTASKSFIVRNVSLRILFIVYIANLFFNIEQVFRITIGTMGLMYFVSQTYIITRLIRYAKFSVSEWVMLYKQQSRFYKVFFWAMILTAVALTGQLIYVTNFLPAVPEAFDLFESAFFVGLLFAFLTMALTDEIAKPIMKLRFNESLFRTPEQDVLIEQTTETRQRQYHMLAIQVLRGNDPFKQQKKEPENEQFTVQSETEWNQTHEESYEEVRERAIDKLKQMRDESKFKRSRKTFALTPEELDGLTEEEVDALLSGPA